MLKLDTLNFSRNSERIIENFSASVEPGELVYISGPNGVGKTTLLDLLAGLLLPDSSESIMKSPGLRTLYLGHKSAIDESLSPLENLRWLCALEALQPVENSLIQALESFGLGHKVHIPAEALSQGQKRRIGLARLFITKARLWLLDEPFTALDSSAVALLEERFKAHAMNGGTVVFSSHQQPESFHARPLVLK